jgi:Ca-activated chloride channel family protein
MIPENDNLEKNISRLVKLADDSGQPNKNFTDMLIDSAIDELTQKASPASRERKSTIMTVKKIFAYAAAILIVCGVLFAVLTPKTSRIKQQALNIKKITSDEKLTMTGNQVPSGSESQPAKLEYTERALKAKSDSVPPAATAVPEQPKPSQLMDSSAAKPEGKASESLYLAKKPVEDKKGFGIYAGSPPLETGSVTRGRLLMEKRPMSCLMPVSPPPPCRTPMAHGGTTPPNGESEDAMFFKNYGINPFIDTEDDHLSTFATDVDTASYTLTRSYLHDGHLPPNDAVRVEEFVNYFKYDYPAPQKDDFAVYTEAAPWSFGQGRTNTCLLRIGLKARQISEENRKPAILTFVIDVSGSMGREDRLGLVKKSLRMLVERLRPDDKIGIAVYDTRGRKLMDYKGLDEKDEILSTIEMLGPGGSTYAEEGIRIGYEMAEKAFQKDHINRVILCTDGVANVGQTGADDILKVIKEKAAKGILLSAIGFGMGNYNDVLLEQLGDKGNGHYAYIDTIAEAKRLFEDNLTGTLEVIARDVKVQVDFNPEVVRSYRLIGYENRDVPDNKFRDDKYDGGEIGAGLSTTALYELKLWPDKKGNIAATYVRYKNAENDSVTEFKSSFGTKKLNRSFAGSSKQFRLAATAAEFAEILRHSYWARGATLKPVLRQAQTLSEEFKGNADVIELVDLISKANRLMPEPAPIEPQPEAIEISSE